MAVPIDHNNPTLEIILDLFIGLSVMGKNEMTMVMQKLSEPGVRRYIKAAIYIESSAGTRHKRVSFNAHKKPWMGMSKQQKP